ncbi:MAG: hypothetical protein GKR88_05320 [Flavobacteriaceae bacterium]|nr:MAG: hypothetical protein GKR88_05320 [Flavobacteriaceae bacterium]
MKKAILLGLLVLSFHSFSQSDKNKLSKSGVISGKVIDEITKEPLPYVNIVVRDVAKKVITVGITGDKGNFKIKNIPEGNNIVEIQYIGYATFSKQINIKNKQRNVNLGTIPDQSQKLCVNLK